MFTWFGRKSGAKTPRPVRSRRARLMLQGLEGRVVPATFTVTNADDSGPGSLRQAILDSTGNGTADDIAFDSTFFNAANPRTITLLAASGQLTINEDLIINGPGASIVTVSGGGSVRPFNVDDATGTQINVTLSGMTVTGGNGTSNGTSGGDGGGIRTTNENLTLENMVVSGNTSGANDGGGITATTTAFITVRNSTISGNTARRGGGIYFFSGGGMLMENSTVSGNTCTETSAAIGGGGIYFFGLVAAGGFTLRNSTIAGNTAATSGGGLVLRYLNGDVLVQNCTITGNTANTTSTGAGYGGGGIALTSGSTGPKNLFIESSIISGNNATAANGRSDISTIASANVTLDFCAVGDADGFAFTGSNNLPFGSALNLLSLANYGGPTATIALGVGSLAVNAGSNPAALTNDQRGAGFPRQVGAAVDIGAFEGTLDVPSASGGPFADVTVAGGTTYSFDITYSGGTPINVSTLDNNDIRVTGPSFNQLATFVSVTPAGNGSPRTATYRITAPGGTFGGEDNGTYTISLQAGQVANTNGGTAPPGAIGTFRVAVAQTYTVTNLDDAGTGSLRQAILDSNTSAGLSDTIVFQSGLTGTITLASELLITDGVTINGPGAAAVTVSGGGAVRVFNVDGGGIIDVTISGLTVSGGNTASDGAGIRTTDERLTLNGMVITGNTATGTNDGGGVTATTTAFITIRNSTISGNTARRGGGVYFFSGGGMLMENSTVSGNTATETGIGNGGGGIYFFGTVAGEFTIRNSTVAGNTAANSGGGLVLRSFTGTALVQNSTFTGNAANTTGTAAGEGGGGIAIGSGSATSILTIESSAISGNTSGNGSDDIATVATATTNVNFSSVFDADGFTPSGSSGNNRPFGEDPLFDTAGLANNGGPTQTVALQATSPLLNVGSNPANLTTDQRGSGFARTSGAGTDIGAFELQGAVAAPRVTAVNLNVGQANTTQRSRVTSINVVFSTQVTFGGTVAAAFQLSRIGGGAVGGFTAVSNIVNGVTVVTLSGFSGAETRSGSLGDGRFQLTVLANQVTAGGQQLDGDGNGTGGDNFVQNGTVGNGLFSFYGDVNGDGIVNAADFGTFRSAFGTAVGNPLYRDFLDFNNDTFINAADFAQFRQRFGATVP